MTKVYIIFLSVIILNVGKNDRSCSNTPYFQLRKNMQQCATASEDGTCIIWDLERFTRSQMVMANSLFQVWLILFFFDISQRNFSV